MLLNIDAEIAACIAKRKKQLTVFIVLSAVFAIAVMLIFFLSGENYVINLIVNIVLTACYGIYAIYLFFTPYKNNVKILKWLKSINNCNPETEYCYFCGRESHNKEGVTVDLLSFRRNDGCMRSVYCLCGFATDLEKDLLYVVKTQGNTLVSYSFKD